jgi:membrane-bound lytic murein transglycosylase MltF
MRIHAAAVRCSAGGPLGASRALFAALGALVLCVAPGGAGADDLEHGLDAHLEETRSGSLEAIVEERYLRVLTSRSSFDYTLHDGVPTGYQAEMVKALAARLTRRYPGTLPVRFELLPVPSDQLIPMLLAGRGDLVAARLTKTERRARQVRFSRSYHPVEEWVVGRKGARLPSSPEDLSGLRFAVRAGSSHAESLAALNDRLRAAGRAPVERVEVDDTLEIEDLLALVAGGRFDWTVTDSMLGEFVERAYPELEVVEEFSLRDQGQLAWALPKDATALAAEVDAVLANFRKGTLRGNIALRKWFSDPGRFDLERDAEGRLVISRYDRMLRRYAREHGFDWRLLASIAYQESRFRATARNRSGAVGLFQIKPQTAAEPYIGIPEVAGPKNVENNVAAAVRYLAWIRQRYFAGRPDVREQDRVRFTLAAYNAGPATVRRAMRQARRMGLDDDVWFGNVELAMVALREGGPVKYVSEINRRVVAYDLLGVAP